MILFALWNKYKQKKDWAKEGIGIEEQGMGLLRVAIADTERQIKELEND